MHSTRFIVGLWLLLTIVILGYALFDLQANPWLREEHAFTMQPDLSRAGDLLHWGGRLLKERAVSLLIMNAVILGGLLAIPVAAALSVFRRDRARRMTKTEDGGPISMS